MYAAMQLGCSLFQSLAQEFSSVDYGRQGVDEFFRPLGDDAKRGYVARSVMIDMEPKVSRQRYHGAA